MTASNPEFEAECIRRILAGEKQLFHDLIRPCERAIYFLCFAAAQRGGGRRCCPGDGDQGLPESATFRGDSQFRTWVLSIARNEGLGRLRKVGTRREDSLEAQTDEQSGDYTPAILTNWREMPAEALERKELGAILRRPSPACPNLP